MQPLHIDLEAVRARARAELSEAALAKRGYASYGEGKDLVGMIKHDLIAERTAIESYFEIIRWIGDSDPSTRRLLEHVLETREGHAEDLASLVARLRN